MYEAPGSPAVTPSTDQMSLLLQNLCQAIDATSKGKSVGAPLTQNDTGRPVQWSCCSFSCATTLLTTITCAMTLSQACQCRSE